MPKTFNDFSFETDLLLLGVLCLHYAANSALCPVRHWGSNISRESVRIENHRYRINSKRVDGVMCLYIRKDIDHYNGGQEWQDIYIPMSELNNLQVTTKAHVEFSEPNAAAA